MVSLFLGKYPSEWLDYVNTQLDDLSNTNRFHEERLREAKKELQFVRIGKTAMDEEIKTLKFQNRGLPAEIESLEKMLQDTNVS